MSDSLQILVYTNGRASNSVASLLPPELFKLSRGWRSSFVRHGFSGVLMFRHGVLFHIVEGPAAGIDSFLREFDQMPYHDQVDVLVREPIDERLFSEWSVSTPTAASTRNRLRVISDRFQSYWTILEGHQRDIVRLFLADANTSLEARRDVPLEKSVLSLRGWPDFRTVGTSEGVLNLCACLYYQSVSFSALEHSGWLSRKHLLNTLEVLRKSALLDAWPDTDKPKKVAYERTNNIYARLRSLLTRVNTV